MRYIKMYEKEDIKIGDQIVLTKGEDIDMNRGFSNGEIYTITDIGKLGFYRYTVSDFSEAPQYGRVTTLGRTQFRKATPVDISINKFNL